MSHIFLLQAEYYNYINEQWRAKLYHEYHDGNFLLNRSYSDSPFGCYSAVADPTPANLQLLHTDIKPQLKYNSHIYLVYSVCKFICLSIEEKRNKNNKRQFNVEMLRFSSTSVIPLLSASSSILNLWSSWSSLRRYLSTRSCIWFAKWTFSSEMKYKYTYKNNS